MRVTLRNLRHLPITLGRPFSSTLGANETRTWAGILQAELEKYTYAVAPLVNKGYISIVTGEDTAIPDSMESSSYHAHHGIDHECFQRIPAAGLALFAATAGAAGTDNAPVAEPAYPANADYVVGALFDGDGWIRTTGVCNDGIIRSETILVTIADAGATLEGDIAFAQVLQIDWDFDATVWTAGTILVQTGVRIGLRRRHIEDLIKANEDSSATPAYTDLPIAGVTVDAVNGTVTVAAIPFSGIETMHFWYTYLTPDYIDTDQSNV